MKRTLILTAFLLAIHGPLLAQSAETSQPADSTALASYQADSADDTSEPVPQAHPNPVDTTSASANAGGYPPLPRRNGLIGLGLQAALPVAGASGIYDFDANNSVQAVLGVFVGETRMLAGRYRYHFFTTLHFQPFIFGEAGVWNYQKETVIGYGAGVGLEYFIERFPFISLNLELNLKSVGFTSDAAPDISGIAVGGGIHYYF
jgi:hypothetical protein